MLWEHEPTSECFDCFFEFSQTFTSVSITIFKPFAFIFNKSSSSGIVSDVFKVSKVTPVFKNGAFSDPSNYRPTATLSPFC